MAKNCEKWCDQDFVLCGNMGWKVSLVDIQYSYFLRLSATFCDYEIGYSGIIFCSILALLGDKGDVEGTKSY